MQDLKRQRVQTVRLACALLLLGVSFAVALPPQDSVPAPEWAVAVLPDGKELSLEIAGDKATRQRGYMFREQVADNEGMLFLFGRDGRHIITTRCISSRCSKQISS